MPPTIFLLFLLALAVPAEGSTPDPRTASQAPVAKESSDASADEPTDNDKEGAPDAREDADGSDDDLQVFEEMEVRERADDLIGIAVSATEGTTGRLDLAKRPIQRPGELIETTPGVVATQHSGGGKANQYFVRGFNLDHGTDFALRVGGVPVNMPSHGHGQGYADLSFVIPEVIDRVRYRKGPYYSDVGDFSSAGSVDLAIVPELSERLLSFTFGSYDFFRALWADDFELGEGNVVTAIEGFHEDGPWTRGQSYEGFKALARYNNGDLERGFSLTFMGYSADWLSTDQVPRRAVSSGLIGPFDLIDPGPRGNTDRFSLSGEWNRGNDRSLTRTRAYLLWYDFGLVSNFTYFLEDAQDGDQFEQADQRWAAGFDWRRSWLSSWNGRTVETNAGFDARFDDIENGLFRTRELVRTRTVREDGIEQLGAGVWADTSIRWHDKVQTRFGLRADLFSADVSSDLEVNSGSEDDVALSPKLSLILGPWNKTELYVNFGYGLHSNDARGAVLAVDPVTGDPAQTVEPLVRARGADVGFRTTRIPGLHSTFTVFVLELDSELVFVGDGGATEASRPSRRFGMEWANFYRLSRHLALDLDLTLTDATFTDDAPEGDEIPGAVGTTLAAGLTFEDLGRFSGSLRWRYFGDVALIEDGSAEWDSSSLLNARIAYHFDNGLELGLDLFNLLDSEDSDIEYFYASRLPGEPAEGIEDVHFHPVGPFSARLTVTWRR